MRTEEMLYNMGTLVLLLGGTYVAWVIILLSIEKYFEKRK